MKSRKAGNEIVRGVLARSVGEHGEYGDWHGGVAESMGCVGVAWSAIECCLHGKKKR